jgi:hypothetical protein
LLNDARGCDNIVPDEAAVLAQFAGLAIGAGLSFDKARLSERQRKGKLAGIKARFARAPGQLLPVDAFSFITLVANPIKRYNIGSETTGLLEGADGSLEIVVQHAAPESAGERANWLPAPAVPSSSSRACASRAQKCLSCATPH